MNEQAALRTRRGLALIGAAAVPLVLVLWGGHAGTHMARNLLVPGAGVIDHAPVVGVTLALLAVGATVLWLRWGADWAVVAVIGVAMVLSAMWAGGDHTSAAPTSRVAAHEFPLVLLVIGAIAWLRSVMGRTPGMRHLVGRRHRTRQGAGDLRSLAPVDRCRAAAVLALAGAGDEHTLQAVTAADVGDRARRVGLVARGRTGGDPFRRDHAHARAARVLVGAADRAELDRLAVDSARTVLGAPCSEPGWIRPLDATLCALALANRGRHDAAATWSVALRDTLFLRRGHRPAWWWTPLGVGAGTMPDWEHATTTALARAAGWLADDDDWTALRRRALGAAARGGDQPDDERLIAAARCWLALLAEPDLEAERIIHRPGVRRDPLACALDTLASRLRSDPLFLHPERSVLQ